MQQPCQCADPKDYLWLQRPTAEGDKVDYLIRSKATDLIQLHRWTQPPFPLPTPCLFFFMKSYSGTIQYVHDIYTNSILFFKSWANLYELSNNSAVALLKMPVPSMPQNKTESHQTTPYTQHSQPTLAGTRYSQKSWVDALHCYIMHYRR